MNKTIENIAVLSLLLALAGCAGGTFSVGAGGDSGAVGVEIPYGAPYGAPPYGAPPYGAPPYGAPYGGPDAGVGGATGVGVGGEVGGGVTRSW